MQQPREKSWWDRNWKWFVPVVGVGGLVALVCLILGILTLVNKLLKSSEAYQGAVATAIAHPAVVEALGEPVVAGWLTTGSIRFSGSSGKADLAIPVSGPNGQAKIFAVAAKAGGEWAYSTLVVQIYSTRERIDLLE